MDNQTLKLKYPIQAADRTIEEVTMRRPLVADLRKYPISGPGDFNGEARQMAALCGLRLEDFDRMDAGDYGRLQDIYISFRASTDTDDLT